MNELKPCPFCGGKGEIFPYDWEDEEGYDDAFAWCVNNKCFFKHTMLRFPSEWNTRQEQNKEAIKKAGNEWYDKSHGGSLDGFIAGAKWAFGIEE